jgi:hypothetical protein
MPEKRDSGSGETPESLPQHPLVGRLKPDPTQPAQRVIELVGLPGDSDRVGYQRLYLTARLDYYAEFQAHDIVYGETVAADVSPIAGQEATKVSIRRDATINYTWVRSPQPLDEFDLDVRLGAAGFAIPAPALPPPTITACNRCVTPTDTCRMPCDVVTAAACRPTGPACPPTGAACVGTYTCGTNCGTCATCQTQCNQDTCATCQTQCNQDTCATCQTQCNQITCAPYCTAGYTFCDQNTCAPTCHTACQQQTCGRFCHPL